jgi:hypothetical protein
VAGKDRILANRMRSGGVAVRIPLFGAILVGLVSGHQTEEGLVWRADAVSRHCRR